MSYPFIVIGIGIYIVFSQIRMYKPMHFFTAINEFIRFAVRADVVNFKTGDFLSVLS